MVSASAMKNTMEWHSQYTNIYDQLNDLSIANYIALHDLKKKIKEFKAQIVSLVTT